MSKLPDYKHPKTFLWIASGADPRTFLKIRTKANIQRIHEMNKIYRVRDDAKLYAEKCAKYPDFRRSFFGGKYNKRFLENLRDARETETPVIIVFCGELAGGGKSLSALKLVLFLDPNFNIQDQLFMNETDFSKAAAAGKLLPFKTYIFDDPDNRRTGAGVIARRERLEILLKQASRHEKTDFLFCSAVKIQDPSINYQNVLFYLESIGKNKKEDLAYFMLYDREKKALGLVYFKNPTLTMPDLVADYLEIKSAFTSHILRTGGRIDTSELEAAALQVMDHAEFYTCINPRNNQIVLSKVAALTYSVYPDSDKMVSHITRKIERMASSGQVDLSKYLKDLIGEVVEEIEESKEEGFYFNESKALTEMSLTSTWTRNIELYNRAAEGKTQDEIALEFNISQVRVSQLTKKVKGELARRLGEEYELFLKDQYEQDPAIKKVIHGGGTGEPDLILVYQDGLTEVISVKCYKSSLARASTSLKISKLKPEIDTAQNLADQGVNVVCLLEYLNYDTKQHIKKEINFKNPPANILIKQK